MTEPKTALAPSVWQLKPWWCQPWSIALTTAVVIGTSWLLWNRWWVTGLVALPMLTWMIYFIGIYPRLFREWYAQQQAGKEG